MASTEGDRVIVTVVDRGTGMPPAVRTRAGEPFFTTRAEGAGMGLGLFVTLSTIDQLGGTMHVSSSEGEGTTVTITLPQDAAKP
jgi:signal transduction histidine kinase